VQYAEQQEFTKQLERQSTTSSSELSELKRETSNEVWGSFPCIDKNLCKYFYKNCFLLMFRIAKIQSFKKSCL